MILSSLGCLDLTYHVSLKKVGRAHAVKLELLCLRLLLLLSRHGPNALVMAVSEVLVLHVGSELFLATIVVLVTGLLSELVLLIVNALTNLS